MPASLIALALAAAPAPASDHQREVERAVFELCPQVMSGSLALDDEAQVSASGYLAAEPRQVEEGPVPTVVRGAGAEQIVIGGSAPGAAPMCMVWFAGRDNGPLANAVKRRARSIGYAGNALRLGDGERVTLLVLRSVAPARVLMISGAESVSGFSGTTTSVTMLNSGE